MQHYSSLPPEWRYQAPPPALHRSAPSQLSTTPSVAHSKRTHPRPPPLSPSSSSGFTSPPPRSPARVPLPSSPAAMVHPISNRVPSINRAQHCKGRSSISDDKIPLGVLQGKARRAKRVRWSAETASGGNCKTSLFRRVSGLGESVAERDARQVESAQRQKAVKGKQLDGSRGAIGAAGSSGPSALSFTSQHPHPSPNPPQGFPAPAYTPFPFYMQPLPFFPGLAGSPFYPTPPMPQAHVTTAPRSHSASPPSSPLSDVEALYENQLRRAPPSPSTLGAPDRPRQPLAEVSNLTAPAYHPPLPGYTTVLPTPFQSRPHPRRPATPPRRLQPIRCDSNSTTEGPSTAGSAFTDEGDYEDTDSSHAWFSKNS